jgi:hypothetical protein
MVDNDQEVGSIDVNQEMEAGAERTVETSSLPRDGGIGGGAPGGGRPGDGYDGRGADPMRPR